MATTVKKLKKYWNTDPCKRYLSEIKKKGDEMGSRNKLSGMQKQVLGLYRGFLRAARLKSLEERQRIELIISSEFRENAKIVDHKNFIYIEYLIRRGRKQLEQLKSADTVGLSTVQGYAPPNSDRRDGVLARKRSEYLDCVSQYYEIPDTERSDDEIGMLRQIAVDCPRTVPDVTFFQQPQVQKSLEKVLYAWAIRHPASGYVQGINDLVTPFLMVYMSEYLEGNVENWSILDLSPQKISNVEADCYWCLSKLLDGMQDHYTFAQPGIQRLVFKLKELVRRIDEPVSRHMEEQGLEFLQFAFRWFNCLLIREIPFHLVTRLWDTYLAEGDALPEFLVYITASFLLTWSDKLRKLEFQEMVMFLQHLPTQNWTHHELEMVLSRAYMWHTMFNSSPSHLAN